METCKNGTLGCGGEGEHRCHAQEKHCPNCQFPPNWNCDCSCHSLSKEEPREWQEMIENHVKKLVMFKNWSDHAKSYNLAKSSSNLFNDEFGKLLHTISTLLQQEKQKSYEEGKEFIRTEILAKGYEDRLSRGRKETLDSLLSTLEELQRSRPISEIGSYLYDKALIDFRTLITHMKDELK